FSYSGDKPFLKLSIASTAGAGPSVWIAVRVLRASGPVDDELSLANLTALCKYAVLRRLTGRAMLDVLTLLRLSGGDPLAVAATPDSALALLDARDTLAGLRLSVGDADQLLGGPTGTRADDLEKKAAALLDTARSANLAILSESTVAPDQRSVLLAKILTD